MNISKDTKKEDIYNFSNIIADSEVVLTKIYGGAPGIFKIGNRVEEPPQKIINIATCKKGTVIICEKYFWNENKHEERNYRGLLKNYLNIWEKIKKYDVFAMETKDWLGKLKEAPDDDIKNLEGTIGKDYEKLLLESDTYLFTFRVGKKTHAFKIYDPENLKDKRYLQLVNDIREFFGWVAKQR